MNNLKWENEPMSYVKKVVTAAYPDKYEIRIGLALDILKKDPIYRGIMSELKLNADKYFNTYNRQKDSIVDEGEKSELDLVKKAEQRQKALGLKKGPGGFIYFAGDL